MVKALFKPCRCMNSWNGSSSDDAKSRFFIFCTLGSLITKVKTRPGSIKRLVTINTVCQSKWSAKIRDKEPGIRLAIL